VTSEVAEQCLQEVQRDLGGRRAVVAGGAETTGDVPSCRWRGGGREAGGPERTFRPALRLVRMRPEPFEAVELNLAELWVKSKG